jgi:hypothetical protein
MQYRLVYDVLNDGPPWLGVFFAVLAFLFAAACFLEIRERLRGKRTATTPRQPRSIEVLPASLVVVLGLFMVGLGAIFAWYTHEAHAQQRQCQVWVRSGEHEVTEGTVAEYEYRRVGTRFRVAGKEFDLSTRSVGFTGRFNEPGAAKESLDDGLPVRVAHREGFILRVEIAADRPRE